MMIWVECTECGNQNEVYCDGDHGIYCPDCRSMDTFKEIEEE